MSQYEKKINLTGMVKKHSVLVKRIAHHLLNRLPSNIQIEDLIQSGMIGLIEAANNFKDDKGASFETYAGIRIRGAMLDEVRKGDWTPRSVHKNSRMITKAIKDIE
ncbi:MAG: sigma-70 family RNA polymerase sigma factor, partial [Francisellaceae bacterium]|nr:sigma-70 family RNA polymerase sigma factor [Francisellaceae bacterium]